MTPDARDDEAMIEALVADLAHHAADVVDAYRAGAPDADEQRDAFRARIFALDGRSARNALAAALTIFVINEDRRRGDD